LRDHFEAGKERGKGKEGRGKGNEGRDGKDEKNAPSSGNKFLATSLTNTA